MLLIVASLVSRPSTNMHNRFNCAGEGNMHNYARNGETRLARCINKGHAVRPNPALACFKPVVKGVLGAGKNKKLAKETQMRQMVNQSDCVMLC